LAQALAAQVAAKPKQLQLAEHRESKMAAHRARSAILPAALLTAFMLGVAGPAFLAPSRGPARAPADAQALAQPLLAASNAVLLANLPAPAHAGGMFDFGLTLPFVAFTFLTMMFVLNTLWYSPVTTEMDDRNAKLLQTLSEATDNLTKADEIQVAYTEQIRVAREKASKAVAEYRKTTEAAINEKMAAATAERNQKASELKAKLEEEIMAKKASAEAQIEKRKAEFLKKTLSGVSL